MSAVLEPALATPALPAEAMLAAVREIADGALAEFAEDIDRGVYPESVLKRLGEVGAYRSHLALDGAEPDYGAAIQAITEVSRVCGATGFMMWVTTCAGSTWKPRATPR